MLGVLWRKKDDQDRHWSHLAMQRVRVLMPELEPSRDPWYTPGDHPNGVVGG